MKTRYLRMVATTFAIILILMLTGCSTSTANVTVKKNGALEIAFSLLLNKQTEWLIGGKLEEMLSEKLGENGITLQKKQDANENTEYLFRKNYASYKDLKVLDTNKGLQALSTLGSLNFIDTQVQQKEAWFYTKHNIVAKPKLNTYTDEILDSLDIVGIPQTIIKSLLQNFTLDFKFTLPVDLYGENNATSRDGNTLMWHLTLTDAQPLEMELLIPNLWNIGITLVGVVVVVVLLIFFIKKSKSKST